MILMEIDKVKKDIKSVKTKLEALNNQINYLSNVSKFCKYYDGCDPIDENIYVKPEFIVCKVTQMRGCKEEGGNLYNVNNDGSVTQWADPPKSVSEALKQGYTIHTIEYIGQEFILRKEIKDKVEADV